MAIELKKNGEIDVKKLTPQELEIMAEIRLDHHKRKLDELKQR